jgi:RNA polymerase sigma factor (sigma-70 family)
MSEDATDIRAFLLACANGDHEARFRFQEEYGEDIYNFPIKIYRLAEEEAGGFYLYVFDNERIFTRLRTFEGRNNIQFRTFLSYYVLKHLFLEWQRTRKNIETVSLSAPIDTASDGESRTLEDVLPSQSHLEVRPEEFAAASSTSAIWNSLTTEERLDLKLLSLSDCELDPGDLRLLAQNSGRSVIDSLAVVAEVQASLRRKDAKLTKLADELDSVWGWILLRQKDWQQIEEKILLMKTQGNAAEQLALRRQQEEIEHALTKRYQQRTRILEELRATKMTTPYKDIARLLNLTVGTVSSRICRLRQRLMQEFGEDATQKEENL